MHYQIRQAVSEDIRPALELALRVFMEYDSLEYGPEHTKRMCLSIEDRIANPDYYLPGNRLMFVALNDKKVVGIIETYGNNRISLMFVDSDYQRHGIATELKSRMVSELKMNGYDEIVLNSSPNGLMFYQHFGLTLFVAVLAILSIVIGCRFKRKMSPWGFVTIILMSVAIFMMSIIFALCLGFFMR